MLSSGITLFQLNSRNKIPTNFTRSRAWLVLRAFEIPSVELHPLYVSILMTWLIKYQWSSKQSCVHFPKQFDSSVIITRLPITLDFNCSPLRIITSTLKKITMSSWWWVGIGILASPSLFCHLSYEECNWICDTQTENGFQDLRVLCFS